MCLCPLGSLPGLEQGHGNLDHLVTSGANPGFLLLGVDCSAETLEMGLADAPTSLS